jgi:hypothetical protein
MLIFTSVNYEPSKDTNMKSYYKLGLIAIFGFALFALGSCEKAVINNGDGDGPMTVASCVGCHTNYAHLQEVYSPDTEAPAGGCGGDAPHYEPYDRVYMGGDGYEAYKASSHNVSCTTCHGGVDGTDDKATAHSGDFLSHPSSNYTETCGACHTDIAEKFGSSIHNGYGQMRKVAIRAGYSGSDDFHLLPENHKEAYNKNCATCHASCGTCHVVRPPIGGGGLISGHNFNKTPDMLNVCVSCHTSRGGHAYLGVATGTKPDVHLTQNRFDCLNCHSGHEMHGDGNKVEQRYAYESMPECKDCHTNNKTNNLYHAMHMEDFNCHVCHSQDYNNCGSCHVGGDGARIPSYLSFKIAVNPIPDIKEGFDFALVRRTLAAPDNWSAQGVENYANFDAEPTYNYTSPHNILRWTSRTEVENGKSCSSNCHIRNEGGELINKDLYLFMEDLLEWELGATARITVDDKLPSGWFTKLMENN